MTRENGGNSPAVDGRSFRVLCDRLGLLDRIITVGVRAYLAYAFICDHQELLPCLNAYDYFLSFPLFLLHSPSLSLLSLASLMIDEIRSRGCNRLSSSWHTLKRATSLSDLPERGEGIFEKNAKNVAPFERRSSPIDSLFVLCITESTRIRLSKTFLSRAGFLTGSGVGSKARGGMPNITIPKNFNCEFQGSSRMKVFVR